MIAFEPSPVWQRPVARLCVVLCLAIAPVCAAAQQVDTTLWTRLHFRFVGPEGNRAIAAVGDPGNSLVSYIGAASGGVWKTDAGRSWQHMGLDSTGRIARIVIDPANPDVVFVCALGRAYGPAQQRGVYRTADGGKTWSRVLFVDPNTGCSDLAIDPGDPNTLFAGMWQFEVKTWHLQSGGPGSGLWASRDGGVTWKRLVGHGLPDAKHVVGKIAVAVAPSNPNTVYALVADRDPTLYRSDDRGNFWRVVSRNHDMAERAPS